MHKTFKKCPKRSKRLTLGKEVRPEKTLVVESKKDDLMIQNSAGSYLGILQETFEVNPVNVME